MANSYVGRALAWVVACAIASLMLASSPNWGQTQSQVRYVYDAAGNLTQVTRSAVTPRPDLTISNLAVGVISASGNGSFNIPATFQVNNIGTSAALATWYDRGYLSADSVLHDTDQALSGYNTRTTNLAVGASYSVSTTFATNTTTTAGNYALIVRADGGAGTAPFSPTGPNAVPESNETNNIQSVAIDLPANPKPDLAISNFTVGAIAVTQSGSYSVPVTFTIANVGALSAKPNWYDLAYLSSDAVLDDADQNWSGYNVRNTALASGASYTTTKTFTSTTATAPGNYTLFIKTDGRGTAIGTGANTDSGFVAEGNEANNLQALALTLPIKADLVVSNVSIGAITVNQAGTYGFPATWTVANNGGSTAPATWYDVGYLSADATLDNADAVIGSLVHSVALAAGASYTTTATFVATAATAPGIYTLFVKADGNGGPLGGTNTDNGRLAEASETNNIQTLSITLPTKPDLTLTNLSFGAITVNPAGAYSFPTTWTVTNNGGSTAPASWYDVGYLSADATLDNADAVIGSPVHSVALAAGASYTTTATFVATAATAPGIYTLFVKADGNGGPLGGNNTDNGRIAEGAEGNNVTSVSVLLP
jgi:CARDB